MWRGRLWLLLRDCGQEGEDERGYLGGKVPILMCMYIALYNE